MRQRDVFGLARLCAAIALGMLCLAATTARAEEARSGVALVIGNGAYEHLPPLENPSNDARAIEDLLDGLGFDVSASSDRDAKKLSRDLERFAEDAEGADVAVLYYSGHGIEAGGENWLVPVDADIASLDDASEKLVPVSALIAKLQATVPVTIVMLDACRNNPFPPGALVRTSPEAAPAPIGTAGLAPSRGAVPLQATDAPTDKVDSIGTVLAFAAEPGKAALDGDPGGNSPYAAAVLRHLDAMAGEEFGTVMRMVAEEVYLKTGGRQRPWVNESLRRLLYFGKAPALPEGGEGEILAERRRLLVTIATLPDPQRHQIETIARDGAVPMDALYAILETLGAKAPEDPAELDKLLRGKTEQLRTLLAERKTLTSTDPDVARLSKLAERALDEGALETARKYQAQAKAKVESLSASIDKAEADVKARRIEFAEVFAQSARINEVSFQFLKAAEDYRKAFEQVERWDVDEARYYKAGEAGALASQGEYSGDNAYLEQAVATYQATAGMIDKARAPRSWASIQNNMAATLFTLGEREASRVNLDRAAEAYQAALTVYTREANADDWASTYSNLATVYWRLGERETGTATLDKAVAAFRAALEVQSSMKLPTEWAATQNNLGIVLSELAERGHAETNLKGAIEAYRAALTVHQRATAPLDWAMSQLNLGGALTKLGDLRKDAAILQEGAAAFEDAALEFTPQRAPAQWANTRNNLSSTLVSLGEIDGDEQLFEKGAEAARDALSVWTHDRAPVNWATGQMTLGTALYRLGAKRKDEALIRQSIAAYEAALTEFTRPDVPLDWAAVQLNLASAWETLSQQQDGTDSLSHSADALHAALDVYTPDAMAREHADAQFRLGNVLSHWGERTSDAAIFDKAIDAYGQALAVRSRDADPVLWGKVQYRLGAAWSRLYTATGGPPEALDRSIAAYRAALEVETPDKNHDRWAAVEWGLGFVLGQKADLTSDEALNREAAAALEASLSGYPRDVDADSFAQINNDLGRARMGVAQATREPADYEKAAEAFSAAIDIYADYPDRRSWAVAQSGLGNTLLLLGGVTGDGATLRRAVTAFDAVLSVTPRTEHPDDWARVSINAANALWRIGGDGDDAALRRAAAIFADVQQLRTSTDQPEQWADLQRNRAGVLGLLAGRTGKASDYAEVIAANRLLADHFGRDRDPKNWASARNEIGYQLMLAGRAAGDPSRFEEAVPILRDAVALQKSIGAVPDVAYTEDSLCDVLVDLGAARKEKVLATEAIAACESALAVFEAGDMKDLADGSRTNLSEARALLASLGP